ncbi:hypothetical protein LIER_17254 [Lithospermum erythrorhizon]|uniref:CBS domain-containing protein n=1 Tax=Lithospermum erythrorhizon TaxID=34254 RepID=A0AAV3QB22_LITER
MYLGALCVFGEIIKQSGRNPDLIPKPHLYLSFMRAFADRGDYYMVKHLHYRMWPESRGTISSNVQVEADHLLMEAALNQGQFDLAVASVRNIMEKWRKISWTSRGGMAVLRIEALLGFSTSLFSPHLLPEVSASDPIERFMMSFDDAQPLHANAKLEQVIMRFYKDPVVPITDTWGSCVGILHREDCNKLDAPLSDMMRSPPPWVKMSTSVGRVIDLMLAKKYKMIIIAKHGDLPGIFYGSSVRAVGVFTFEKLCKLTLPSSREMMDNHFTMSAESI